MNDLNDILLGPPLEPVPVGMSYSGPGWIVLYSVIILLLCIMAFLLWKKYKNNAYRRDAIEALKSIPGSGSQSLLYILSVLKSTAMISYGRNDLAYLTGTELFRYFNRKYHVFDTILAEKINDAVYSGHKELLPQEQQEFITQTQTWIRNHGI